MTLDEQIAWDEQFEPARDEPEPPYVEPCPVCAAPIDYCQGHGEIGDPDGWRILQMHDADDHSECHRHGCVDAMEDPL